jgi:hypothetical protein
MGGAAAAAHRRHPRPREVTGLESEALADAPRRPYTAPM